MPGEQLAGISRSTTQSSRRRQQQPLQVPLDQVAVVGRQQQQVVAGVSGLVGVAVEGAGQGQGSTVNKGLTLQMQTVS